jgi:Tfp pilus assembly PilM family ATPase/Tfp pilus assembly protein PilN
MPKQVLGIELGDQQLTLVQLTGTAKAYEITAALQQPVPQHADPDEQLAAQRQTLQELLATQRLRGDTVLVSLPAHHAVLRNVTLPFKDPRRIRQVIKYTLDENMPFEPDEVVVDFLMLPAAAADQASLFAAVVPQEIIAQTLGTLQSVNLEPTIIDLDVFGLANAVVLGSQTLPARTIVVDTQPARTLVTLLNHDKAVFARSLAQGWPQDDVSISMHAARLSKQLQHTIYAYENAMQQTYEADVVLFSGDYGTQLDLLTPPIQEELGVPAEGWRLTAEAYKGGISSLPSTGQAHYAVALGTALRGLYRQAAGLNLRRERFALHRDIEELRGRLVGLGCLLIFIAALGLGSLYLDNHYKAQHYAQLQEEIGRMFRSTLPDVRMVQPIFQMREKVQELSDRLRAFGGVTGAQLSGLQILREISARIPTAITLEVDALTISADTVDLSGKTGSYDDVVKLKDALEASPAIASAKINNTKTADEANQVVFKLTLSIAKTLENIS